MGMEGTAVLILLLLDTNNGNDANENVVFDNVNILVLKQFPWDISQCYIYSGYSSIVWDVGSLLIRRHPIEIYSHDDDPFWVYIRHKGTNVIIEIGPWIYGVNY